MPGDEAAETGRRFAEVVVQADAPGLPQPFTYAVPDGLELAVGSPVLVPFGAQQVAGYVVGLADTPPADVPLAKIKPIVALLGPPAFDAALYQLAQWVVSQTLCDLRDALRLIAPDVLTAQVKTTLLLADDWEARLATTRSAAQKELATALASLGGAAEPGKVARAAGQEKIGAALADLRRKGVVREERSVRLPKAKARSVRLLRLIVEPSVGHEEAQRLERGGASRQARLLRALLDAQAQNASLPTSGLAIGASAGAAARALAEKGLAAYAEVPLRRDPFRFFGFVSAAAPALTDAQTQAARTIGEHLAVQDGRTILLYGVTGSGKTEVYLEAVARTRAQGQGALVLLPEIGLTAQVVDLFKARFGEDDVAVLHSALSSGERHDEWRRIQSGTAGVVVGARSAVFAPVARLGLIVIDEEHDGSYKQDSAPRYHARDAARQRAAQTGAVVLLGSATPSVESYYQAQSGEYGLVTLTERIASRPLPPVQVVDLREEFRMGEKGKRGTPTPGPSPFGKGEGRSLADATASCPSDSPLPLAGEGPGVGVPSDEPPPSLFSRALQDALTDRLARREQAILFLNRRGFASFLLCRDCGFSFQCPNCAVSLTYHRGARLLQCHHCDHRRRAPEVCPKCSGLRLRPFGLGTEKVEAEVVRLFPEARSLRMDRDTMARKGAHAETLRAFRRGEADFLIGTQMVAKGLDFPRVTLVGVVSADTALNIPDFRSAERAFQLLTQVAGRAGRGETPGQVYVQTFTPDHQSVCRAAEHDYLGFYAEEIAARRELGYPPFSHLVNAVYSDEDETQVQGRCRHFADVLTLALEREAVPAQILGPVACPLSRLRGRYRWHLVLRGPDKAALLSVLRAGLAGMTATERAGLTLDIDPLTML